MFNRNPYVDRRAGTAYFTAPAMPKIVCLITNMTKTPSSRASPKCPPLLCISPAKSYSTQVKNDAPLDDLDDGLDDDSNNNSDSQSDSESESDDSESESGAGSEGASDEFKSDARETLKSLRGGWGSALRDDKKKNTTKCGARKPSGPMSPA